MSRRQLGRRGLALFFVLMAFLVILALANVILVNTASQNIMINHNIDRVQAYYAAIAGINYAFEKLRVGDWDFNSCDPPGWCDVVETEFPHSILNQRVRIRFCADGQLDCPHPGMTLCHPSAVLAGPNFCIHAFVEYE